MAELEQMFNSLGPFSGELQWNLALYWLFFLNLLLLFMVPDGSTMQTALAIIVLISTVIDKTFGFGYLLDPGRYSPQYYHEQIFIGTYLIRVAMFVAPATIAGSTRNGKVRAIGILAAISGAVYSFGRWFFQQRDNPTNVISMVPMQSEFVAQSVGMMLILAQITLRRHFRLGRVDRYIPVAVARKLPADKLEV